jgi:hypothetical protein
LLLLLLLLLLLFGGRHEHFPEFTIGKFNKGNKAIGGTHAQLQTVGRPGRVDQVAIVDPRDDREGMVVVGVVNNNAVPRQDTKNTPVVNVAIFLAIVGDLEEDGIRPDTDGWLLGVERKRNNKECEV